ncbi:transglycosylase domain-containing protein, partial [Ignavibacterium sp.]
MAKKNLDQIKKKKRIIIASAAIIFLIIVIYIISGLPSLEELENPRPILASKVFSADGELIGQFFIENRIETNIDSLPKHLIEALIATEDKNFYDHWGVDLGRFFKA